AEDGRSDRIEDGNGHRTHRDETNRDERAGGHRSTIAVTCSLPTRRYATPARAQRSIVTQPCDRRGSGLPVACVQSPAAVPESIALVAGRRMASGFIEPSSFSKAYSTSDFHERAVRSSSRSRG